MVFESSEGKAKKQHGHGKSGMMAPVGSQHWEKDVADVECCNAKYTSKDSMANPEHLKKSVDGLSSYVKKNEMKYP